MKIKLDTRFKGNALLGREPQGNSSEERSVAENSGEQMQEDVLAC